MNRKIKKLILGIMAASAVFMASCGLQEKEENLPWESGGKQPSEYSWEEFEALTQNQQMAFQYCFSTQDAFDNWLQSVQVVETLNIEVPWEKGGKQPYEYTWEEFENLTAEQQILFQNDFENIVAFDQWLQHVNPAMEEETVCPVIPWENGGKLPDQYAWEEFENLTVEQQMLFQNYFENMDAFDQWLQRVKPEDAEESVSVDLPWIKGGKHPSLYTWEEYEQLTAEQQVKFQECFSSMKQFDQWMQRAQQKNAVTDAASSDYTWEAFENLTVEQQMAFQNSFNNFEEFDAWLQKAQADAGKVS